MQQVFSADVKLKFQSLISSRHEELAEEKAGAYPPHLPCNVHIDLDSQ